MSHRAYVAIQSGDGTFDIHYSHNGADDLQLLPTLEEHLESGSSRDLLSDQRLQYVHQIQTWADRGQESSSRVEHQGSNRAIDPDPEAIDIPASGIGNGIEYDDIEAFYVVTDSVDVTIPVWANPDVIRPIRDGMEIEIYPAERLSGGPEEVQKRIDEKEPLRVVTEETFDGPWLDDSLVERVIRDHHADIIALARLALEQRPEDPEEIESMLMLESDIVTIRITDPEVLPETGGDGMLVRPFGEHDHAPYDIREIGAKKRFSIGAQLAAMRKPDEDDLLEARVDLATELAAEFTTDIAEFSPPPYGMLPKLFARLSPENFEAGAEKWFDRSDDDFVGL